MLGINTSAVINAELSHNFLTYTVVIKKLEYVVSYARHGYQRQVAYGYNTIGVDGWIQIRLIIFIKYFKHPNLSSAQGVRVWHNDACMLTK